MKGFERQNDQSTSTNRELFCAALFLFCKTKNTKKNIILKACAAAEANVYVYV